MSLRNLILFLCYFFFITFVTAINGYQKVDWILYFMMVYSSIALIIDYIENKKRQKLIEDFKANFKELSKDLKLLKVKQGIKPDCSSYADSMHLFCSIHPQRKNCIDCEDFKVASN